MGLNGLLAQPLLLVRLVLLEVPREPENLAVAFEREDVGGDAIEEPPVV